MSTEVNKEAEFSEDIFESMLDGSFEAEEVVEDDLDEDALEDEDIDDVEDIDEDGEHDEDTDVEDDLEDEDDLDEPGDGEADEELEDDEDDDGENTPVDDDDLDEEDEDEDADEDGDDESLEDEDDVEDDESEDETETTDTNDGKDLDTDGVDYKAFYEAVTNTEFTVNGKKSKGFTDPQKIIQSMQMAGGFSEKMAGFKQYRPFMNPLKERGMLEDQTKFDLAMNIIDGDKEAIKQHLQSLSIDPLDLDMEAIKYEGKATTASSASMVVDDAVERARSGGYEDRFRKVIGSDWDTESFNEFVDNPQVRADLLDHMESGAYDKVTDKMSELSRLDYNGSYGNMSSIAKYRAAVTELQKETPAAAQVPVVDEPAQRVAQKPVKKKSSVSAEKAKIKKSREEAAYKEEVKAKNAKIAKQRKRASSVSKKKPKAKPAAKFDPMKVPEGEELSNLMDELINSGRA